MAHHVCPWWVGYFLASPIRRFVHNPRRILAPYIRPGMTVMDLGPGMATFTLDLARFTGPTGRVIAADVQPRMLERVKKRAAKAGLLDRIETRLVGDDGSWAKDLEGKVDFALAFYMVHEVPDARAFFTFIRSTLAPGGKLLVVEPKMHVSARAFAGTVDAARQAGFEIVDSPKIPRSRSALLAPLSLLSHRRSALLGLVLTTGRCSDVPPGSVQLRDSDCLIQGGRFYRLWRRRRRLQLARGLCT